MDLQVVRTDESIIANGVFTIINIAGEELRQVDHRRFDDDHWCRDIGFEGGVEDQFVTVLDTDWHNLPFNRNQIVSHCDLLRGNRTSTDPYSAIDALVLVRRHVIAVDTHRKVAEKRFA